MRFALCLLFVFVPVLCSVLFVGLILFLSFCFLCLTLCAVLFASLLLFNTHFVSKLSSLFLPSCSFCLLLIVFSRALCFGFPRSCFCCHCLLLACTLLQSLLLCLLSFAFVFAVDYCSMPFYVECIAVACANSCCEPSREFVQGWPFKCS